MKRFFYKTSCTLMILLLSTCAISILNNKQVPIPNNLDTPSWIDVNYLPIDGASRRGVKLEGLADIVVHYVGNPNTTAQQNYDYFANENSDISSHFLIGLEGEIIQCLPLDEKSSATNWRNNDTISIEVCHPDESGEFTQQTYASLIKLLTWLTGNFDLSTENIIRHYDVTGKSCPKYYVENQDKWEQLKIDVTENKTDNTI